MGSFFETFPDIFKHSCYINHGRERERERERTERDGKEQGTDYRRKYLGKRLVKGSLAEGNETYKSWQLLKSSTITIFSIACLIVSIPKELF